MTFDWEGAKLEQEAMARAKSEEELRARCAIFWIG